MPATVIHETDDRQERQWVAAAQGGDPDAFRRIVELYRDRLYTFLLRLVRHHEEAEDLAQETFVRAWRHLADYNSRWAFRSWLFTLARNLALNTLRRPRATIVSIEAGEMDGQLGLALAATTASPADQAAVREQKRRLSQALGQLSAQAAMVFTLFYQEGMAIAEIAQTVGMTAGAVKVALHRARERLRRRLGDSPQNEKPTRT